MKILHFSGNLKTVKDATILVLQNRLTATRISIETFEYPVRLPYESSVTYEEDGRTFTIINTGADILITPSKDVASVLESVAQAKLPISRLILSTEEFQGRNGAGTMLRASVGMKDDTEIGAGA